MISSLGIDNGMSKISNLAPVSMSLQILCLCDQNITIMENLDLPNLRELYLHRNQIRKIDGLGGCPRLSKLWLSQNEIDDISDLHNVPELEECWLQANQITSLTGIQHNQHLKILMLAGNPISDLKEMKKLAFCPKLQEISFSDIHFGRCPIMDEEGFREYLILQFKSLRVIDGVRVSREMQMTAEELYYQEVSSCKFPETVTGEQ